MVLPVTLTIAGALALVNIWLSTRVVGMRVKGGASLGDGGDERMQARVRAHANLTEYAPFALILLALLELAGASPTGLWAAGALFVLGRLLHPLGLERPAPNPLRAGGIALTLGILSVLAVWALATSYRAAARPAVTGIELNPNRV